MDKKAEQWTTGINQTSEAVDGFAMAKDCENGWDYMKYLKFLVSMKKNSASKLPFHGYYRGKY